jgi:hypothetical protein
MPTLTYNWMIRNVVKDRLVISPWYSWNIAESGVKHQNSNSNSFSNMKLNARLGSSLISCHIYHVIYLFIVKTLNSCYIETTYAISSNLAQSGCTGYSIQHYVIKFVSDLKQVGCFHRVARIPPPIELTVTIKMKYCWKWR